MNPGSVPAPGTVRVKRVYDTPEAGDGTRVLVDRLWPRGLGKEAARLDEWPKSVTPSTELRRWYHQQPADRYEEFRRRYDAELAGPEPAAALARLRELVRSGTPLTLLTSAKPLGRTHAEVLARLISAP